MDIANKLLRIAKNVQSVYNAGRTKGYRQGYAQGFEVGKAEVIVSSDAYEEGRIAERIAFWEVNQEGGNRMHYTNAYSYIGFDDTNFNPIYPIAPTNKNGISNMFYFNNKITDTKVNIIVTDVSARQAFANCYALQRIPYIEFKRCTDFTNTFASCSSLSYIRVGGESEIDKSIDFKSCPLDLESAKSVISHLKDLYESGEQFTYSISFSDYTQALLDNDTEGWVDKDGQLLSWRNYISDSIGWSS